MVTHLPKLLARDLGSNPGRFLTLDTFCKWFLLSISNEMTLNDFLWILLTFPLLFTRAWDLLIIKYKVRWSIQSTIITRQHWKSFFFPFFPKTLVFFSGCIVIGRFRWLGETLGFLHLLHWFGPWRGTGAGSRWAGQWSWAGSASSWERAAWAGT